MESASDFPGFETLPAGDGLLRLDGGGSWPAVCAVLRPAGDGGSPAPVLLRTTTTATVWLGALCDHGRQVLRRLELWVQRTDDAPGPAFGNVSRDPAAVEARWEAVTRALQAADPGRTILLGTEDRPHPPVEGPGGLTFPANGGRLLVRSMPSMALEDYTQLLTTGQLPASPPRAGAPARRDLRHFPGAFLQGWSGDRPPLGEVFHLKVRLIAKLAEALAAFGGVARSPLLNVTRHSWGIDWAGPEAPLAAWCARPVLTLPPAVVEWTASGDAGDPVFFLNAEHHAPSVYLHPGVRPPRVISGSVRMRELRPVRHTRGAFECEGTLTTTEPLPATSDRLLIDCPLAGAPVAAAVAGTDPGRGEVVFRSSPWTATPQTAAAVESGGYSPPAMQCQTAIVPGLTPAADLYSAGVIALEILCCGNRPALPLALDELIRVGRRLEQDDTPSEKLAAGLAALARRESDAPWVETLHPRHLVGPAVPPESAWRAIPHDAWFSVLAICLQMLTGQTRYAHASGPDDGATAALVFEPVIAALAGAGARTRGLAIMDWQSGREIREEILELLR